jgi:hypothetical protein
MLAAPPPFALETTLTQMMWTARDSDIGKPALLLYRVGSRRKARNSVVALWSPLGYRFGSVARLQPSKGSRPLGLQIQVLPRMALWASSVATGLRQRIVASALSDRGPFLAAYENLYISRIFQQVS